MKLLRLSVVTVACACATISYAQTQAPVVVQQVPAATNTSAPDAASANQPAPGNAAVLKTLQEMKAANDELIRKQTATLQQLDEMEKAAAEMKIYTKRG